MQWRDIDARHACPVIAAGRLALSILPGKDAAESVLSGRRSGAEMARLYEISEPTVPRIVATQHQTRSTHESQP
jgi:hypothetical protein